MGSSDGGESGSGPTSRTKPDLRVLDAGPDYTPFVAHLKKGKAACAKASAARRSHAEAGAKGKGKVHVAACVSAIRWRSDVIAENYGLENGVVSGTHGETEAAAVSWSGGICEGGGEAVRAGDRFGGRRGQIEVTLQGTPIEKDFPVIVSAEDVMIGKPDPAIYELAFKQVNSVQPRPASIKSEERLVIEDSKAGIRSARADGMKVATLATTYPTEQLKDGNLVLTTLEGVSLERLQAFSQQ